MPIAVFLGMHLLFTDPATSRRTELGRIVYGVLYRFILRGSKGPFPDREPEQLCARACVQGWPGTCGTQ